jgi:inosine/xanthosine triphosphatase
MLVAVASSNPVKLRAVQQGFARMFPGQQFEFTSVPAPSLVSDQPSTDAETLQGALNRARGAANTCPQADYSVGLEGGIEDAGEEMAAFAWVAVLSGGRLGKARTTTFFLPPPVAALVRSGVELGHADDLVFGKSNSKQDNGAVGILTGNATDRAQAYALGVILALAPFKNPGLYFA